MNTRKILLSSSALIMFVGFVPGPAQAQTVDQPGAAATEENDGVLLVVTGSRLERSNLEAATPVVAMTDRDLDLRGVTNVADIVRTMPAFNVGSSPTNTTFNTAGAGANFLDLRGLGTNRTLVLVDGRRHVGGGSNLAVDINTIPAALVSRVEVTTGGASAVYGADAVAGVVNFILKDDFEGLEVNAQYGEATRGGAEDLRLSALVGGNFGGGRGNATVFAEYNRSRGINQDDRQIDGCSFIDNSENTGPSDGIPDLVPVCSGAFTQPDFAAAGGRAAFFDGFAGYPAPYNGPFIITDDGQSARPYDLGQDLGRGVFIGGDGVNFDETRNYLVPVKRLLLGAKGTYELSAGLEAFIDVKYSRAKVDYDQSPWFQLFTIDENNPFLPPSLATALQADPTRSSVSFFRWDEDWGRREIGVNTDTFRVAAGLDYDLSDQWKLSGFYQYGEVDSSVTQRTYAAGRLFSQAADPIIVDGKLVCRNATARAGGCLPLNPFALSTLGLDDPAVARLRPIVNSETRIKQDVANAVVTGRLPQFFFAEPVRVAAGVEYRKESLATRPDALSQSADIIFGRALPLSGSYDAIDGFGEVAITVLRDIPFARELNLEGALRVSNYSTVGTKFTWKMGGSWQPVNDLRLRGVYAQAVRAPNVVELFTAARRSDVGVDDPCDVRVINQGSSSRPANCAALGLAAGFRARANDGFSVTTVTTGNPKLDAEVAKTLTLGAIFTPRFVPRLTLSVDYFDIKIRDVVNTFDAQTILNSCVDFESINNDFCGSVSRGVDGQISEIALQVINAAQLKTSGVDFEARYSAPLLGGQLRLQGVATYLDEYVFRPSIAATDRIERRGVGTFPRWRGNANAVYVRGPLTLSWVARLYGSVGIGTSRADAATSEQQDPHRYKAQLYNDVQVRFTPPKLPFELFVGANNLFNKSLPYTYFAGGLDGASGYDVIGRFVYAGAKARF